MFTSLTLWVDGVNVPMQHLNYEVATFCLRLPVREIRALSASARPVDVCPPSTDVRRLGVAVLRLWFEQGQATAVCPLGSELPAEGFHDPETQSQHDSLWRWTNGNALLPDAWIPPWNGETLLHIAHRNWRGSLPEPALAPDLPPVLNAFESLGANCELAFAQQYFSRTRPGGLLAWSCVSLENLMCGLRDRFSALEQPSALHIHWNGHEYLVTTPYFKTHTGHNKHEPAQEAEILQRTAARLGLLRRKLLNDLQSGRKILVFKAHLGMTLAQMHALHAQVQAIGPATLLCVTARSPATTCAGESPAVQCLGPGLYHGEISKFVHNLGPYTEWYDLCRQTLALHPMPTHTTP